MAKEWAKFETEYKKIKPKLKTLGSAESKKVEARIRKAHGFCWEGEDYLRECMATARENGVTGSSLADFSKDATFKGGIKALNTATNNLEEEVNLLKSMSAEAKTLYDKVSGLCADIEKDLKKRKDSSASKKDILALKKTLEDSKPDLDKTVKAHGALTKAYTSYAGNLTKTITNILKEAPEAHARKKEATELPELLRDRILVKNVNAVKTLLKSITTACDSAMDKAAEDVKSAVPHLKKASEDGKALKKINDQYQAVKKKFPNAIKDSKDQKKLNASIDAIAKAFTEAERKVRGTTTTIKKSMA